MTSTLTRFGFVVDNARALAGAAGWAARSIPSRPTPPVLGGMVLEVIESGTLRVSGFDWDVCGRATVACEGEPAGRVLVSGRLFAEVLKTLPAKPLQASADDKALTLTCGTTRVTLPLMPAEDYPALLVAGEPLGSVDAQEFARLMLRVGVAADLRGDRSAPALTGVWLDFGADGTVSALGTNRQRAATGHIDWKMAGSAGGTALVPAATLLDLARSIDAPGGLVVGLTDGLVSFGGVGQDVIARVLDAKDFPVKMRSMVPARSATPAVFSVAEALTAVKRAALMLGKDEPVELRAENGTLTVSGGGADDDLACEYGGPPAGARFKVAYLADALSAVDAPMVELSFPPVGRKTVLFTAVDDGAYAHFIQPIVDPKG